MQAHIEGPHISQGWLEALETNARIYTFTKQEAGEGTSNVVIDQLFVANQSAYVLIVSRERHSFVSYKFSRNLRQKGDRICQTFSTSMPSGEVCCLTISYMLHQLLSLKESCSFIWSSLIFVTTTLSWEWIS